MGRVEMGSSSPTLPPSGWHGDADDNGSKMIELWGLSVTSPRGSMILSCTLSYDSSGLLKAPRL